MQMSLEKSRKIKGIVECWKKTPVDNYIYL